VVEEREARRKTMLARLGKVNVEKLERRLTSVAEALQEAESEHWREALAARLAKRAKRLGAAIGAAGQIYNPESLHQVRIATKKLRYGLEIAGEGGIRSANALVRRLKRAQDTLGRLHDLQVLEVHVAAVRAAAPASELPEGSLAAIARTIEEECRHLHGRYISMAPALLGSIDATRQVAADLARASTRRRTLKMTVPSRTSRSASAAAETVPARRARQ
jgi:CHAD domain-containing protein